MRERRARNSETGYLRLAPRVRCCTDVERAVNDTSDIRRSVKDLGCRGHAEASRFPLAWRRRYAGGEAEAATACALAVCRAGARERLGSTGGRTPKPTPCYPSAGEGLTASFLRQRGRASPCNRSPKLQGTRQIATSSRTTPALRGECLPSIRNRAKRKPMSPSVTPLPPHLQLQSLLSQRCLRVLPSGLFPVTQHAQLLLQALDLGLCRGSVARARRARVPRFFLCSSRRERCPSAAGPDGSRDGSSTP